MGAYEGESGGIYFTRVTFNSQVYNRQIEYLH